MLVLTRKPNQSVVVDGPCRITVLRSACKLGIEGDAKVVRQELLNDEAKSPPSPPVVYLVDDDADLLSAYECYLALFGFSVKPFKHGGAFLQHVQDDGEGCAAVVDLRLAEEDIDGLQILRQLRAWDHDYPVILLTGYGDVDTCRRAFHYGCYTFLQKPLPSEELAATVKEAVSRYTRGEVGNRHRFSSLAG